MRNYQTCDDCGLALKPAVISAAEAAQVGGGSPTLPLPPPSPTTADALRLLLFPKRPLLFPPTPDWGQ